MTTGNDPYSMADTQQSELEGVESCSYDTSNQERLFITQIHAKEVVSSLGRSPRGFYVAVEIDGKISESPSKPASRGDLVEWDKVILLPSERSCVILFNVYASFELGPGLGKGELLGLLETTVGEVLNHSEQLQRKSFLVSRESFGETSHWSLKVTTEQRSWDVNEYRATHDQTGSDRTSKMAQLTDAGHHFLLRHAENQNQKDLDEAVACFERAYEMCPLDHPHRSTALYNLARARLVECEANDHVDFDVPITLLRNAFDLRSTTHPDHCATALDLSTALLDRFERRHDENDMREAKSLLSRTMHLFSDESGSRVVFAVLRLAEVAMPRTWSGTPQTGSGDREDEELLQRAQCALANLPDRDPGRAALLERFARLLKNRFADSGNISDIDESITMSEMAVTFTPNEHPEKATRLDLLGRSLGVRFGCSGDLADVNRSVWMLEEAVRLTPNDHPNKPVELGELATSLSLRFGHVGDIADINRSILMLEEAVYLTPDGHPNEPTWLSELAYSLSRRFGHLGDLADIDKSISAFEEVVRLTPDGHQNLPAWLGSLATLLSRRFLLIGDIADIDKSISIFEETLCHTPDGHSNKPTLLENFATSLSERFNRLGDIADINKSISINEEILRLTPDDHQGIPTKLGGLALMLSRRFDRLGDIADINKSILMLEEALLHTPTGHPNRPDCLGELACSLSRRFDHLGDIADINNSIALHEEAVRLTPNGHPRELNRSCNLAISLSHRFNRLSNIADIDKSISIHEDIVRLMSDDHPIMETSLGSLAYSLSRRFWYLGDIADIDKCISMYEKVLHRTPTGHPNKPTWLGELARSLCRRFDHLGDITDINNSIKMHEEALRLIPNEHPSRPTRLSNLAISLAGRFHHLGDIADINKSILMHEEAVRITPDFHPNKPGALGELAVSLSNRFDHLGDTADIDKSISMHEEAVRLTSSGHSNEPARLCELGGSLLRRFHHLGEVADINKSISVLEEADRLTSNEHVNKPVILSNFASSLLGRFEHLGDITDINKSISIHEESVRLTPNGHFSKPGRLAELGKALVSYYKRVRDPSILVTATCRLSEAATSPTGSMHQRFRAACEWMSCVRMTGNYQALLEPCTTAISLLPQLAWLGLPFAERHRALLYAAGITSDAAAAAIDVGRPTMAVEWLEQGRSIVWNQLLNLRAPADDLRLAHPMLAGRFLQISHELENISSRQTRTADIGFSPRVQNTESSSLEEETQRHHELVLKRDKLLEEIRKLPGFERFLLPKTIEQLSSFARSGPVVYLNASKQRCDALIFKAGLQDVILVPFPDVIHRDLEFLLRLFLKGTRNPVISLDDVSELVSSSAEPPSQRLLSKVTDRGLSDKRPGEPMEIEESGPDDWLRKILEYLWIEIVNPVLKALGKLTIPSGAETLPRIFWCPTGPFSFLPMHAAGLYDAANSAPGNKLSDYAVSSYIPTLSALAPLAEKDSNSLSSQARLVAVSQPPNDGQMKLPCVKEEIDHIQKLSDSSPFVTLHSSEGTVEDVVENMKRSDWVHFACHGVQDRERPLNSGLCLADKRRLKLSDIIGLSRPQGGLAFLSACQTARGDQKLPEESVHLAAGMLLAGYSGIIATMWSIKDRDAPQVTKDVYRYLFRDGKVPDPLEAAEALHYAIQRLRGSGASFSSWVPFIHVGR